MSSVFLILFVLHPLPSADLVETLLRKHLLKPNSIRCGNWDLLPLRPEQLQYAATDAFASLAVYCSLAALPAKQKREVPQLKHETYLKNSPAPAAPPPETMKQMMKAALQLPLPD